MGIDIELLGAFGLHIDGAAVPVRGADQPFLDQRHLLGRHLHPQGRRVDGRSGGVLEAPVPAHEGRLVRVGGRPVTRV